jgi:hypothetical protein
MWVGSEVAEGVGEENKFGRGTDLRCARKSRNEKTEKIYFHRENVGCTV